MRKMVHAHPYEILKSERIKKKKKKDTWLKIFEVRGKTSDCKNAKGQSWVVHYIKFHVKTNASTTVAETKI